MTTRTAYTVCNLCDAICGLEVTVDGDRVAGIRGDDADPFSRGHLCPKGAALGEVQHDPDRLRAPLRRRGSRWEEIGWGEALDQAARALAHVRSTSGPDSIAVYLGNPTAHSMGATLFAIPLVRWLGTHTVFSANSVDSLPRVLVSDLLYGNQARIPVPDLDRTEHLLMLGANPVVSNGSAMTAPGVTRRLRELRARAGKLVVIDPRRTETAAIADEHHFIRPGGDAFLLLGMAHVLVTEGLVRMGRLAEWVDGVSDVERLARRFPPERVAAATGIDPAVIRRLARELAASPAAAVYGRIGTCTQEFGTLASWLIDVLNVLTGNLDRRGGAMFTTPAVDLAGLARWLGQTGSFDRWRGRASGYAEFNGELPVAGLAEELEYSGPGRVRAMLIHAGNPVLSLPNGPRIERALERLEHVIAVDFYVNETTRHAHLILPPPSPLESEHYPFIEHALAVRNTAHYAAPVLPKPPGAPDDWEILLELGVRIASRGGFAARLAAGAVGTAARALGPRGVLGALLAIGPHGWLRGLGRRGARLTLGRVEREAHGIDLGALEPRLPQVLDTADRRIRLAPRRILDDAARLESRLVELAARPGERAATPRPLLLIGRRELRSNNSWMHNSPHLVRGRERCVLLMNPHDAERRGLDTGARARVSTATGAIEVPVEITLELMPGVVSLPHGWGHGSPGARLSVASLRPGVNVNQLVDERSVDRLSGTSVLNGVPVEVSAASA